MIEYEDKFPLGLNDEEKAALSWKIEQDYLSSNLSAVSYKNEYVVFAIQFYMRSVYSVEDVVAQYRLHIFAEKNRKLTQAFMTDMKSKLRTYELAYN